jgi:predicted RNA-binding Zn ribbon-like protein
MQPDEPSEIALGSLALDFLHTLRRTRRGVVDLVPTPSHLLAWLDHHDESGRRPGLGERLSVPETRILFDEARRLRTDVEALVAAHARGGQIPALALYGLNRVLATSRCSSRLASVPSGSVVLETVDESTSPLAPLGPLALAAARLVTTVDSSRLRRCASARCGTWFVDTSKGGRRRWCSMARCGNRDKAAKHRGKRRTN